MKREFVENILKAKEYEAKALAALLPDTIGTHVKMIQKEIAAMVWECAVREKKGKECGRESENKKVHKVNIQ